MAQLTHPIYPLTTGFHGPIRPTPNPELVAQFGYDRFVPSTNSADHTDEELHQIAQTIRRDIIHELVEAKSGHSGGPLGSADIFATLYFGGVMRYDPLNPWWPERDRFILSAGHMCPVLYATLRECRFFSKGGIADSSKI